MKIPTRSSYTSRDDVHKELILDQRIAIHISSLVLPVM